MRIFVGFTVSLVLAMVFASALFIFEAKAADDVTILSTTIYQTYGYAPFSSSKGDYIVAGEVKNVGSEAAHFNITATFYDASDAVLGYSFLSDSLPDAPTCYLHVLLPGKRSPFAIWFSRFDGTGNFRIVDHYELTVLSSPAGAYHTGFELVSESSHEAGGSLFAEGELKNIGTAYIDGYNVFVTWYKSTGDVLAVSSEGGGFTMVDPVSGERGLAPNQTWEFMVALDGFNEGGRLADVARHEVTAEGYDYSLWTDGQLTSPEVAYVLGIVEDEGSEGPSSFPLVYLVAAAIAAAVALVLILLFLRRRMRIRHSQSSIESS